MTIDTPRGQARSMTPLSPTSVTVHYDQHGEGSDWFGALTPVHPIAPPEVAGRAWDYTPGFNLQTQPRAFEPVTFQTLRILSESYDPLRLIIERRKDQICRLPWTIRVKHDRNSQPTTKAQVSAATRDRIEEIRNLFERPSYGENFRSWLRALIEDLLVIDAPSIYLRRDGRGNLTSLQVTDGATLKRVLDDWGRMPEPIEWSGQPFDWNSKTITSANFLEEGFKYLHGFAWPVCWQQVLHGMPAVNLTALDLLQRPMNIRPGHPYGLSPCEQVLTTVAIAMRRAGSQLEYFREGSQPDALFMVPPDWAPQQIQNYQDYFDNLLSGNFAQRRKLKFIPGGSKSDYIATKEPPLKNEFDEWIARIICFAFSYPPTAFVNLSNRSVSEQHERTAEEEGLEPLKQWASDTFNEIIRDHLGEDDLEFAWTEESDVDQVKQSAILTRYVDSGVITRNEARDRLGLEPDPNPIASKLTVKTATGYALIDDGQAEPAEDNTTKITKGAVVMLAPADWKRCVRFSLGGTTYLPDLEKNQLVVYSEIDVLKLEAAGWAQKHQKEQFT